MSEQGPKPPQYTAEGTLEWRLMHSAEVFFADRDETLRFDLMKRVIQWMLDTDENAWFEKTLDGQLAEEREYGKGNRIRSGEEEIESYIAALRTDTKMKRLGNEVAVFSSYLDTIKGSVPSQYGARLEIVQEQLQSDGTHRGVAKLRRLAKRAFYIFNDEEWQRI